MHTMIHTSTATGTAANRSTAKSRFCSPHYDWRHEEDTMKLNVCVPGVIASGVDITMRGPDLTIIARKERFVRPNWNGLQLERVQRDYLLRLRIGYSYDPATMTAVVSNGLLTLRLPRRAAAPPEPALAGAA